jgi:hypothetical protein
MKFTHDLEKLQDTLTLTSEEELELEELYYKLWEDDRL